MVEMPKSELVRAVLEKNNIKQQGNREHDHTNHRRLLLTESPRVFDHGISE
ncbi:MAG TPA: hypothetical protein VHK27_02935 [Gammaproteobacteria bacterium]|nr:hypothetical protein [Gammaproteobacteria bacterium]